MFATIALCVCATSATIFGGGSSRSSKGDSGSSSSSSKVVKIINSDGGHGGHGGGYPTKTPDEIVTVIHIQGSSGGHGYGGSGYGGSSHSSAPAKLIKVRYFIYFQSFQYWNVVVEYCVNWLIQRTLR